MPADDQPAECEGEILVLPRRIRPFGDGSQSRYPRKESGSSFLSNPLKLWRAAVGDDENYVYVIARS
jgi:hypothetical protein